MFRLGLLGTYLRSHTELASIRIDFGSSKKQIVNEHMYKPLFSLDDFFCSRREYIQWGFECGPTRGPCAQDVPYRLKSSRNHAFGS